MKMIKKSEVIKELKEIYANYQSENIQECYNYFIQTKKGKDGNAYKGNKPIKEIMKQNDFITYLQNKKGLIF